MFGEQRWIFDKGGIRYKFFKQKYLKNYFTKVSFSSA